MSSAAVVIGSLRVNLWFFLENVVPGEATLAFSFLGHVSMGSTLDEKNLLPQGFRWVCHQGKQTRSHKDVPLRNKYGQKTWRCIQTP